jgi:hypothetical protein
MPWANFCNNFTYLSMASIFRFKPLSAIPFLPPLRRALRSFHFTLLLVLLVLLLSEAEGNSTHGFIPLRSAIFRTTTLRRRLRRLNHRFFLNESVFDPHPNSVVRTLHSTFSQGSRSHSEPSPTQPLLQMDYPLFYSCARLHAYYLFASWHQPCRHLRRNLK